MNLPKRDELSFLIVFAFPNASIAGFAFIDFQIDARQYQQTNQNKVFLKSTWDNLIFERTLEPITSVAWCTILIRFVWKSSYDRKVANYFFGIHSLPSTRLTLKQCYIEVTWWKIRWLRSTYRWSAWIDFHGLSTCWYRRYRRWRKDVVEPQIDVFLCKRPQRWGRILEAFYMDWRWRRRDQNKYRSGNGYNARANYTKLLVRKDMSNWPYLHWCNTFYHFQIRPIKSKLKSKQIENDAEIANGDRSNELARHRAG